MLQANPALTPSAVKGDSAGVGGTHQDYSVLTQGAGFLNARAAVELARDLIGLEQSVTFDAFVAYEDEASTPPACEAGTDCVMLTESCLAAGCFEREAGGRRRCGGGADGNRALGRTGRARGPTPHSGERTKPTPEGIMTLGFFA